MLTLAKLGDRQIIPKIVHFLESGDTWRREAHIMALVQMQATEAWPYLQAQLTDSGKRRQGMLALAALAPALSVPQQQEAVRFLRRQLNSSDWFIRMAAVDSLGKFGARETIGDVLGVLDQGDLPQEEAVVGVALGKMEGTPALVRQLETAFTRRDGHICGAVIYAWGALSDPRAAHPLVSALEYGDDYLTKTNDLLGDEHFEYLRARMAMGLGRLAVSLAEDSGGRDLSRGWNTLVDGLRPAHPLSSQALKHPTPPRVLYEQMTLASGSKARTLGLLVGAYEWSEVFACLAERKEIENEAVWRRLIRVLDPDLKDDELHKRQNQLAQRIGWRLERRLPFAYLTLLRKYPESHLKSLAWHFPHQARAWKDFLEWRRQYLAL